MNLGSPAKIILHIHELHLKAPDQSILKFVVFQGDQATQTKLESRKEILLVNNKASIEEAFELSPPKDGKILIIILRTKHKETTFLGQVNLDTHRYVQQGLQTINLESAISKCTEKDQNARLLLTVTFPKKQPSREFQVQRAMSKEVQKPSPPSTHSIISDSGSESTIRGAQVPSRKTSVDSHKKNYKQLQILREDNKDRKDKNEATGKDPKSRQRSGSYRKRFEYQEGIAKGKNTIVFLKKKKEKEREQAPVARQRTPEPINLSPIKPSQSKTKGLSSRPRIVTERSLEKTSKMVISIHAKTQRYETESQAVKEGRSNTFSKGSLKSNDGDKFNGLLDKLKEIEMKIEDKKSEGKSLVGQFEKSGDQSSLSENMASVDWQEAKLSENMKSKSPRDQCDSICTFGDAVKVSHDGDLPTTQQLHLKIAELEQKISILEESEINKQKLIQKLTQRYQKIIEELEGVREPYQRQISRLRAEVDKVKPLKPASSSNLQTELKNEKRRIMNLQNTLQLKDNEIKHLKLNINLLQDQRKHLELLLAQKESRAGKNSSRAILQAELMATGFPSAVKSENQLLRSQNLLLQKHIKQLNSLVEQSELKNTASVNLLKEKELQDLKSMAVLLNQNIEVLQQKSRKLEEQLRKTKMTFADVMNVVFQKGGQQLVECIENRITQNRESNYSDGKE